MGDPEDLENLIETSLKLFFGTKEMRKSFDLIHLVLVIQTGLLM